MWKHAYHLSQLLRPLRITVVRRLLGCSPAFPDHRVCVCVSLPILRTFARRGGRGFDCLKAAEVRLVASMVLLRTTSFRLFADQY